MCSPETEKKLAKILMILAEGERSIEISRQVLSDLKEFDSFQIFKNIDIEDNNKIDCYSIINYLRTKGIYCTEEEACLIILFYDQDYDNALSYPEFINIIQSDKVLKKSLNKYPKDKIPFDIEYSLIKLLEKEVELSRTIIYSLKDIRCRYDFNIHNLYHKLKYFNSITDESIKNYLENNQISYLESDIKSIKKRLDLNKDGIIDLCEFHALLGFPDCVYCCPCINCESCGKCLCDSCYNNIPCYLHGNIQNNKGSMNDGEIDNYSFDKILNKKAYLTQLSEESRNLDYNKNQFHTQLYNMKENETENLNNKDIKQFNEFLKLLMEAETEIEEIKIELSKREDFNCGDAFRIFDKCNNGFLTEDDLKKGLCSIGIIVDDFLINLMFKRFDLLKKGELNYPDFFDMMVPFEKKYRNDVEQRNQKSFSYEQSIELLNKETKEIMKNVLNVIIRFEEEINEKRKEINTLIRKLKDIFNLFDKNDLGYIEYDEFINYIKENELMDDKGLSADLLFIRLDKNRNGKIVFEDFADEFEALY